MTKGKITQIIGPVVDFEFAPNELPKLIGNGRNHGNNKNLVVEIQQQLGVNQVRGVAMDSTDGLVRGQEALATGKSISVPVGEKSSWKALKRPWRAY